MDYTIESASADIRAAILDATQGLVERESLAEMIILGAVANEHVITIGPPGTAKSSAVRNISKALGGQYFEYLLGRYTEPSELFGTIDFNKLREGKVETQTHGMLPEADIVFLDEVFLGSTAVLNTLLGVLNERQFRRGHTSLQCPLRICVGASNALPEDEALAAFADRFLLHVFVDVVPDSMLENLLEESWSLNSKIPQVDQGLAKIEFLSEAAAKTDMSGITSHLAQCIRLLRENGVNLSDRRIVKSQKLISAAAVMAGRTKPTQADLWPLIYAIPTKAGQTLAKTVLKDQLQYTENATMAMAAEDASASQASRVARLLEASSKAIDESAEKLHCQAILREIDACFNEHTLPLELKQKRGELVAMAEDA